MLDHVSLGVADLERSRHFYDPTLRPLGLVRLLDFEGRGSDYGSVPHPHGVEFTITTEGAVEPSRGAHLCFRAPDRAAVRAFHAAAAGGVDDGAAGLRPNYHPSYYAAFVLDPDGHRIEAVVGRRPAPMTAWRADNGHPPYRDRTVELGPQGDIRPRKGQGSRWSAATSPRRALDYSTTSVGLRVTAWDTL